MAIRSCAAALTACALVAEISRSAAEVTHLKRDALKDLSGGFCRSYKFGVSISNDILYMVGLDGGLIPDDGDANNNYLVTLNLKSPFAIDRGANYKMTLVDSVVPKVKQQALWSDKSNSTLFMYGGRYVSNTTANPTTYTYSISDKKWAVQESSLQPNRLVDGAYTDARDIQAAYWIGGYQDSTTSLNFKSSDKMVYGTGMLQFNTTTQEFTSLDAPVTPVQEGALLYIPVGEMGLLVFIGGDTPSVKDGTDAKLYANSWDSVQVYDISAQKWYNQTTTGQVMSRTQFCATVHYDAAMSSYAIYVLGGAQLNGTGEDAMTDVSYLTIPSFKWHSAAPLKERRMTHACTAYGRQIFAVGGRLAWAEDAVAGCYKVPAFIYDAQAEEVSTNFKPEASSFALPDAAASAVKSSPYPSSWADPALKDLFVAKSSNNDTGSADTKPDSSKKSSTSVGAIAGGVVGGVAAIALIVGAIVFCLRRQRQTQTQQGARENKGHPQRAPVELYSDELRGELDGGFRPVFELDSRVK